MNYPQIQLRASLVLIWRPLPGASPVWVLEIWRFKSLMDPSPPQARPYSPHDIDHALPLEWWRFVLRRTCGWVIPFRQQFLKGISDFGVRQSLSTKTSWIPTQKTSKVDCASNWQWQWNISTASVDSDQTLDRDLEALWWALWTPQTSTRCWFTWWRPSRELHLGIWKRSWVYRRPQHQFFTVS